MAVLKVKDIKDYDEYVLVDVHTKKEYSFILEFQDCDKPNKADFLAINDSLLDSNYQEYSKSYSFGNPKSKYGRKYPSETEIAMLKKGDIYIKLKRIYG